MTKAVQTQGVWKTYPGAAGPLDVLREVSFSVEAGEMVGIVGASGSGKSTLLHILGALDRPSAGQLAIGGFDPFRGTDAQVSDFRNRRVGFVFQHNNLLPEFTALENVMLPGLIAGRSPEELRKTARALLERVGMGHRLDHFPGQLSGGEQQRVAIGRALINQPVLVLADEPSGNLDSHNAANIHNLFYEINKNLGTTVIIVTHNEALARTLPRVLHLHDGEIVKESHNEQTFACSQQF